MSSSHDHLGLVELSDPTKMSRSLGDYHKTSKDGSDELELESESIRGKELENRLRQLVDSGDTDGAYGPEFMMTTREIQKISRQSPITLTSDEIIELGLGPLTPLELRNHELRRTRKVYVMLSVQTKEGFIVTRKEKRRIIEEAKLLKAQARAKAEGSKQVICLPPSSPNAWKPLRQRAVQNVPDEEAAIRNICGNVRALLNKVTPTTKRYFIDEFLSYEISSTPKLLTAVVGVVLEKAVSDPMYCNLYVQVCQAKVAQDMRLSKKSLLEDAISATVTQVFRNSRSRKSKKQAEIREENDLTKQKVNGSMDTQKLQETRLGLVTFIGELYLNHSMEKEQITGYLWELLKSVRSRENQKRPIKKDNVSQTEVFYGLHLLELVGKLMDREYKYPFSNRFIKLLKASENALSNKNRFKLMELVDLKERRWRPRVSNHLKPKTIGEIRKDMEKKMKYIAQKQEKKSVKSVWMTILHLPDVSSSTSS
ncbi:hypothetical protein GCK72_005067 [Caenorhabditis remanei]|uniref:MIF4G domain-containing protein n=1 Tax=Caenorhabditis remanei TaxID=31234 RepID=A0A6A5HCU3_CAERE|nr:hypothetical protein GCK72_005067 [Caenorhabditis remanei]KAF1765115.1 hypothetical protein GCK72_005067 [Caenorhabditis remanei]